MTVTEDNVGQLTPLEHFAEANAEKSTGRQLQAIRAAAPELREWFRRQGEVSGLRTCDLVALPYPREFALLRASVSPAPFVRIFNRMFVAQWQDPDGRTRTLLAEPTDWVQAANTPFFARLEGRMPWLRRVTVEEHGTVLQHLERLGIRPEDVDYLTFDHLHTQDLRRLLGTTTPQPDLDGGDPVEPWFPNARLLVFRAEWEAIRDLHPLQRRWYQPDTYRDLRTDSVVLLDHDVLVGPGVALVATPGHSLGNHTVVFNTSSGVWTSSENGVHPECYQPERSAMPGMRRLAEEYGMEVVLNGNTPELFATQYNNMVKEKLICDRGGPGGEWVQHFCSSELTPWRLAPGASPSFTYGELRSGSIEPSA